MSFLVKADGCEKHPGVFMSVVAAFASRGGKRVRSVSLDAPETLQTSKGEFVWIGVVDPSEHELLILRDCLGRSNRVVGNAAGASARYRRKASFR